jgi:sugar phosphate isomerase/epimerase
MAGDGAHSERIGFFVRPWQSFPLSDALAGIAASGARLVGYQALGRQPVIAPDAAPDGLAVAECAIADQGLKLVLYRPVVPFHLSNEEFLAVFKRHFDLARRFSVDKLLFTAPGRADEHDRFWQVMPLAADEAQRRGMTFLLKPHGGLMGTAEDCLRVVRRFDHPAIRICYDPGNVVYYTGADPLHRLDALVPYLGALSVKDCTAPESGGGTVMVSPGQGKVDFRRLFEILNGCGFSGPSLVETLAEGALEEVNRQARQAVNFVRGVAER